MRDIAQELVLDIYETVAVPSRWSQVLDKLAERTGARGTAIFELSGLASQRRIHVPYMSGDYDREAMETYLRIFREWELEDHDAFERHSLAADGVDLIDSRALYPDAPDAERPHHKVLEQYDIRYRIGCLLDKDNPARGRFTFQFREAGKVLSPDQHEEIKLLMPHAAKALSLGRPAMELASLRQGLLQAMDRLSVGVCILDARAGIVAINEEFRRQIDGHALLGVDGSGRLKIESTSAARVFQSMFDDIALHGRFGARPRKEAIPLGDAPGAGALCLELTPLDRLAEAGTTPFSGAILYSLDTSRPVHVDMEAVGQVFGLTTAEQELAGLINEGLTNGQIAERRGRSVDTIRTQVKSVLAKTNCANRTQLVRVLSGFESRWVRD